MQVLTLQQIVLLLTLVSQGLLLMRMWRDDLFRRYPFLTAFLAVQSVQVAVLLPFDIRARVYGIVYYVSSPILWLLAYFVVLELYRLILEDYPGILSIGRKGVTWCMVLAVATAAALAVTGSLHSQSSYRFVRVFLAVERSAVLGLLVFLVLIQIFLFRYHLRLSRNRMIYSIGYAAYFAIGIAADIIDVEFLGASAFRPVSLACAAVSNVILLAGAVLLTSAGEEKAAFDEQGADGDRRRLQQQLTEMNAMLTRVARAGRG